MKSSDLWHSTVGIAMICGCLGIIAVIAYLLFGPPVSWQLFEDRTMATSTPAETPVVVKPSPLDSVSGVLFTCSAEKALKASFTSSGVALTLSDGRAVILPQTISASGARYANPDESFVFWNKGTTAFIQENGSETYSDCATNQ